ASSVLPPADFTGLHETAIETGDEARLQRRSGSLADHAPARAAPQSGALLERGKDRGPAGGRAEIARSYRYPARGGNRSRGTDPRAEQRPPGRDPGRHRPDAHTGG